MSNTPAHVREAQRGHAVIGVESVMTDNGRDFASKWITGPGENIEFDTLAIELDEAKAELQRFRSERSYVVGVNDGYEAAEERFQEQVREIADEVIELRERNSALHETVHALVNRMPERAETVAELRTALYMPRPDDTSGFDERGMIIWQNRQTRWDVAYATLSAWERIKYALIGAEGIGLPVRDL